MEERNVLGVKTIFVPSYVEEVNIEKSLKKVKIKEKRIGLISAVQFVNYLEKVKKYLEKEGKEVFIAGQMVGCNAARAINIKEEVEVFLFIGSGEFHPLEVIDATKKEIYLLNPVSETFGKFDKTLLEKIEKKRNARLAKYQLAKKIGIIVSMKPGQQALKTAIKFAEKCGKEAYIFMGDEVDLRRLEDFNDISIWVNTCCPRLEANNIVSLREVMGAKIVSYHTY